MDASRGRVDTFVRVVQCPDRLDSPMDDRDRETAIADLQQQLLTLKAEKADLAEECVHLAAWIPEFRKQFGNPFYYSHPTEPDEGIANYNPNSHMGAQTLTAFMRVDRDIARIEGRLRQLEAYRVPS